MFRFVWFCLLLAVATSSLVDGVFAATAQEEIIESNELSVCFFRPYYEPLLAFVVFPFVRFFASYFSLIPLTAFVSKGCFFIVHAILLVCCCMTWGWVRQFFGVCDALVYAYRDRSVIEALIELSCYIATASFYILARFMRYYFLRYVHVSIWPERRHRTFLRKQLIQDDGACCSPYPVSSSRASPACLSSSPTLRPIVINLPVKFSPTALSSQEPSRTILQSSIKTRAYQKALLDTIDKHGHDACWLRALIQFYRSHEARRLPRPTLPLSVVHRILDDAFAYFNSLSSLSTLELSHPLQKAIIVGDLHGQYSDLVAIVDTFGLPIPAAQDMEAASYPMYVFNGDFIDRGPDSIPVIMTLLAMALTFPEQVMLNRGNHEGSSLNISPPHGFYYQLVALYPKSVKGNAGGQQLFKKYCKTFERFPLATVLADAVFIVHAGVPRQSDVSLDIIRSLDRSHEPSKQGHAVLNDLLWSDPDREARHSPFEFGDDWQPNTQRRISILYSERTLDRFLRHNQLQRVVRSHEAMDEGYEILFSGKLMTVFSASCYEGLKNNGAVLVVERKATRGEACEIDAESTIDQALTFTIQPFYL